MNARLRELSQELMGLSAGAGGAEAATVAEVARELAEEISGPAAGSSDAS